MGKTSKKAKNKKGKDRKDSKTKAQQRPAIEDGQSTSSPNATAKSELLDKMAPYSYFFINEINEYLKHQVFPKPYYALNCRHPFSEVALENFKDVIILLVKKGIPLHLFANLFCNRLEMLKSKAIEKGLNIFDPKVEQMLDAEMEKYFFNFAFLSPELKNGRMLSNLFMIFIDLLKPMAVKMAVEIRRELLSLSDDEDEKGEKDKKGDKVADKTSPALFVMLTTLGNQKVVAIYAGHCESNWKAYLLGLVPNTNTDKFDISLTNADCTSKLNHLNLVALKAFKSAMLQLCPDKNEYLQFVRSHVKVLVHDEQLANAAATIANITPGMLTLQNVNSLVRPLVVEHCRRYYNRVGSKKLAKKNIPTIPQSICLLLDIVVPLFLRYGYYIWKRRGDELSIICEMSLEELPSTPSYPYGAKVLTSEKGNVSGGSGLSGGKAFLVEEHLIEWIAFTLAYIKLIKEFGLEQLEQWEKENNNSGSSDGGKSKDENFDSKKDCPLVKELKGKLGGPDNIRQFFLNAEETLLMVKEDHLAPLFDLYDLLHGKGLREQTVSGFVSRLQELKVKYSQQKKEVAYGDPEKKDDNSPDNNHWPAWTGQLFEQIQAEITADPSFCGYRKALKQMKLKHEQEKIEKKEEIVENCPNEITSTPPLHQLLDTVPLVAYDFSHLPTFFALELERMANLEKSNLAWRLSGYSHVTSVIFFNKRWFEPAAPQYLDVLKMMKTKVGVDDGMQKKDEEENMRFYQEIGQMLDSLNLTNLRN